MSEADDIKEFTRLVGVDDGIREMTKVEVSMFLIESTDPHNGKLRRTRDPIRIRQLRRAHEKNFISAYAFCKLTGTDPKTLSPKDYKNYLQGVEFDKLTIEQKNEWTSRFLAKLRTRRRLIMANENGSRRTP